METIFSALRLPGIQSKMGSWKNKPYLGSFWQNGAVGSGSHETGVHAREKYRFKRLYFEFNQFPPFLTLQFSGLTVASFFGRYFRS